MTNASGAYVGAARLLWGIAWRSILWHTTATFMLGGLYGCAVVVVLFVAPFPSGGVLVWVLWVLALISAVAGSIVGWRKASAIDQKIRPLLGAVIGALAGAALGGFYLSFTFVFAFPVGAIYGGAFGLATGTVNALLVTFVTRAYFFPLHNPTTHRRVVSIVSVPSMLAVPGPWVMSLLDSPGRGKFGDITTGVFWGDALIYAGFPAFVLALVAQWLGGHLAEWFARASR